jgi:hypothetical protein
MLLDGSQIFVPEPAALGPPSLDVGQDACPTHNGLFAPIPCGGDRPKNVPERLRHRYAGPWTTDRPINRFSFLTLRAEMRSRYLSTVASSSLLTVLAAGLAGEDYVHRGVAERAWLRWLHRLACNEPRGPDDVCRLWGNVRA